MTQSLRKGIVLIRNAIDLETQQNIGSMSLELAQSEKFKFSVNSRDRIYDAISAYPNPTYLLDLCQNFLSQANAIDDTIIPSIPTHLLFLKYKNKNGMGYHRDDGKNDGKDLYPVVSLSVGNSCRFLMKQNNDDELIDIMLNSGDVIIFGGECRNILHKIHSVRLNTSPEAVFNIIGNERLNLTFRYAPEIIGKEDQYEIFDAKDTAIKNKVEQKLN